MNASRIPVLLALSFLLGGCGGGSASAPPPAPTPSTGSLAWFGFAGVRCGVDDPHDDTTKSDYVDEVAGFTNLVHVCAFSPDVRPLLRDLPDAGVTALLDVSSLLFERVPGVAPSGAATRLALRTDAEARWQSLLAASGDVLDARHVGALYLVDEPAWNGAPAADVARAADLVKGSFPDIPILVVEAPGALRDAIFPPAVDWVGFDLYGVLDPAASVEWQDALATLRARAESTQRIVLIPDTQWFPLYREAGIEEADMATLARNYLAFAERTPDVVALVGYAWPGGIDPPEQRGARDLTPEVRAAYRDIGRTILARR